MLLVPPQKPTILSTNVPLIEDGIDVFSPGNYSLSAKVQKGEDIFESLKDNNTDTPIAETTTLSWKYIGKVNYMRLFDSKMSSSTANINELVYELSISDIDTVCFFGLNATYVKVEIFDSLNVSRYNKTIETYTRDVSDWARWSSTKATYKTIAFFKDIPLIFQGKIKFTISNIDSIAKCSHVVFGESVDLGITLVDQKPTSSIRNIISKEKQPDGTVITSNSMTYRRITAYVFLDTKRASEVQSILEHYTVDPVLFIADEREGGIDVLVCFGYHKDFEMAIGLDNTEYQLEIEGIV